MQGAGRKSTWKFPGIRYVLAYHNCYFDFICFTSIPSLLVEDASREFGVASTIAACGETIDAPRCPVEGPHLDGGNPRYSIVDVQLAAVVSGNVLQTPVRRL